MTTRKTASALSVLALGLFLAVPGASAQETAADPHHPPAGAQTGDPAAAATGPAQPNAAAMPHDMMAMCPMMGTMMHQMMAAMMGQGMMGQGMMGQGTMGQGMAASGQQAAGADAAAAAYKRAHEAMMMAMMAPLSGDADRDFAAQMIPHHQGAIDMARVELEHGSDPQLRKMAEEIIAAQEKEIGVLKAWLEGHPQ